MVNETSAIIDYYPVEFECDLNGKQQEWEVSRTILPLNQFWLGKAELKFLYIQSVPVYFNDRLFATAYCLG